MRHGQTDRQTFGKEYDPEDRKTTNWQSLEVPNKHEKQVDGENMKMNENKKKKTKEEKRERETDRQTDRQTEKERETSKGKREIKYLIE